MQTKKARFIPKTVATADFANGSKFRIEQINARGACAIFNITNPLKHNISHAKSLENAWANVRYQAKITFKTQRSS